MTEFTEVPILQWLRPNRKRRYTKIERPPEIVAMAGAFIAAGGWFESELLSDERTVSLTACLILDDEPQDIEIVIARNGPEVEAATDKLVTKATKRLAQYHARGAKIDPNGVPYRMTMDMEVTDD